MTEVVIAHFSSQEVADLAASFLRRHGVKTRVPSFYHATSMGSLYTGAGIGEYPVIVREDQAEKAWKLLTRVQAGEFMGEELSDNPRRQLGAKLYLAWLPAPGYRAPSLWTAWAPFLVIILAFVVAVLAVPLLRLVRTALG